MKKTLLSTISAAIIATAAFSAQANVLSDIVDTCKSGVRAAAAAPRNFMSNMTSNFGAGSISKGLNNFKSAGVETFKCLNDIKDAAKSGTSFKFAGASYYAATGIGHLTKASFNTTLGAARLAVGVPTLLVQQAYKHPVMTAVAAAGVTALATYNPATGELLNLGRTTVKYNAIAQGHALQALASLTSNIPGTAGTMLSSGLNLMSSICGGIGQTI
jgi:hypothetical protein